MRSAVGQNFPVGFGHRAGIGSQYHHQGIPKANGSWGLDWLRPFVGNTSGGVGQYSQGSVRLIGETAT